MNKSVYEEIVTASEPKEPNEVETVPMHMP